MGGYSEENISGGTSEQIGNQRETSEDYSGHRRLDCPSRPQTLARQQFYGGGLGSTNQTPTKRTSGRQTEQDGHRTGGIVGSPSPRGVINSRWLQTPRDWLAPTRIQGRADPRFRIPRQWMQDSENWGGYKTRTNYGVWNEAGFLKAHRLTA